MSNRISEPDRKRLEKIFNAGADRVDEKPEDYINGADVSKSYCCDCAEKEIERLQKENPEEEYFIDGGWGLTGDSQEFCETCGAVLDNDLHKLCRRILKGEGFVAGDRVKISRLIAPEDLPIGSTGTVQAIDDLCKGMLIILWDAGWTGLYSPKDILKGGE